MAGHPTIPELDTAGLRRFALTTGAIVAVLFGVALPWLFDLVWPRWPWFVGGVLAVWGLVHAGSLGPVYRGWMRFGLLLNRVTSPIILGLVFFAIFTPLAVAMRLFGRDTMSRTIERDAQTYREPARQRNAKSMENPF